MLKSFKESQYLNMTVESLAEDIYPNTTYDTALPHEWVMQIRTFTGGDPDRDPTRWPARCVFGYPKGSIFGRPLPLTREAEELLEQFSPL